MGGRDGRLLLVAGIVWLIVVVAAEAGNDGDVKNVNSTLHDAAQGEPHAPHETTDLNVWYNFIVFVLFFSIFSTPFFWSWNTPPRREPMLGDLPVGVAAQQRPLLAIPPKNVQPPVV